MDRTQYTNLAKAWEFTEEHARERESNALTDARTAADKSGQLQGSAAQARLLGMLVRITGAASVIAVGTGSLVETLQLAHALDNKGLLTAVDSTAQGIALIRKAFAELQDETDTTLRAVNAPASVFLPRLNANDYDLIVVSVSSCSSANALRIRELCRHVRPGLPSAARARRDRVHRCAGVGGRSGRHDQSGRPQRQGHRHA